MGGGLPNPLDADLPWRQTSLDADPPGHVTCDACWEANLPPPPWTEGMTDTCENITLPQTSFVDGKNLLFVSGTSHNRKL